jgi:hypothetical protein
MSRISKSTVLVAVAALTAATAGLGAGPSAGASSMIAARICTAIKGDLGHATFKQAYGTEAQCERKFAPSAKSAIAACLKKNEPGTDSWRNCIQAHVDAAAKAAMRSASKPKSVSTTTTVPTPTVSSPPAEQIQSGTISALSASSITVGSLTCTIGSSSPSVSGYKVGDRAGMGCDGGVLSRINTPPA